MNPAEFNAVGPEEVIVQAITRFLRDREWLVMRTHGNLYQHGFPDLYITHRKYGGRWVEVKNPKSYSFTPAQMEYFPLLAANGTNIWILVAGTQEEYDKLFKPPNWLGYMIDKLG